MRISDLYGAVATNVHDEAVRWRMYTIIKAVMTVRGDLRLRNDVDDMFDKKTDVVNRLIKQDYGICAEDVDDFFSRVEELLSCLSETDMNATATAAAAAAVTTVARREEKEEGREQPPCGCALYSTSSDDSTYDPDLTDEVDDDVATVTKQAAHAALTARVRSTVALASAGVALAISVTLALSWWYRSSSSSEYECR